MGRPEQNNTSVTPEAMTLEQARRLCRQRGVWLRCKAEYDDGRTLTADDWSVVASQVLGYPVVERDDTAELVEALAFARSVILGGESWSETCERVIGGALAKLNERAS